MKVQNIKILNGIIKFIMIINHAQFMKNIMTNKSFLAEYLKNMAHNLSLYFN